MALEGGALPPLQAGMGGGGTCPWCPLLLPPMYWYLLTDKDHFQFLSSWSNRFLMEFLHPFSHAAVVLCTISWLLSTGLVVYTCMGFQAVVSYNSAPCMHTRSSLSRSQNAYRRITHAQYIQRLNIT